MLCFWTLSIVLSLNLDLIILQSLVKTYSCTERHERSLSCFVDEIYGKTTVVTHVQFNYGELKRIKQSEPRRA
jgi:hypothetical protein